MNPSRLNQTRSDGQLKMTSSRCGAEQEANRFASTWREEKGTRSDLAPASTSIGVTTIPEGLARRLGSQNGDGQAIPTALRSQFEAALGFDLSAVRVHTDNVAAESAIELGADAFTIENHIFFGANQYSPSTAEGQNLLAHEVAHTVHSPPNLVQCQRSKKKKPKKEDGPTTLTQESKEDPLGPKDLSGKTDSGALRQVQAVASLEAEDRKKALQGKDSAIDKALQRRRKAIEGELSKVANLEQTWAKDKKAGLEAALKKDLQGIVSDSSEERWLNPDLRGDVLKAVTARETKLAEISSLEKKWPFDRLDSVFADQSVIAALKSSGLSSAELKAQLAQESYDFTGLKERPDIVGIAQMGSAAAKTTGMEPADRKDEKKAVLMAARYDSWNRMAISAHLSNVSADEMRWFTMAAYNAGQVAINSIDSSVSTWDDAVAGGYKSKLFKALKSTNQYAKGDKAEKKYEEVVKYIERIRVRLAAVE